MALMRIALLISISLMLCIQSFAQCTVTGPGAETVCISTVMANITHTTTGATGIGAATGLPAGVSASWADSVITISGDPTVSGTFSYSIPLTGGCGNVNATGTIIVTPANTVSVASSAPTLCISTSLTPITHTTTGATGIGAATGLPAGVSASWADSVITISGDPTASGTFNYSIPLTGGCGIVNATGTIIVTPNHSIALSSANSTQTRCQGVAIANITYSLSGGATGATVAGLPSGLTSSVNGTTLTITGSSTQTGTYNYTVTTTGNSCTVASETGTITVAPNHSIALSSANNTQTICEGVAIMPIIYNLSGGATGATVTGLPSGVTSSVSGTTLTISGTPLLPSSIPFNYTVTTTGNTCTVAMATGTITINPNSTIALTSGAGSNIQTRCQGVAINSITYSIGGGGTGAILTGTLPVGVTGSYSGGVFTISGTPTSFGTFNYTVTTTGGGCTQVSATGAITVNALPTISGMLSVCINSTTQLTGNGTAASTNPWTSSTPSVATVTNNGLVTGVTAGTTTITYTNSNGCQQMATVTVIMNNTVSAASSAPTLCISTPLAPITHTTAGATGISNNNVAGANGLPAGVSAMWASNTITISGTPTVSGTFSYSIPLTGGCGNVNATGTIIVTPANTVSVASSTPTLCISTPLTPITHTTTGATGIGAATGLPAGVSASWADSVITISGDPTVSGTFSYSIPLTGGCGNVNATGTIIVTPANTVSVASSTPTLCISTPLTPITHTTTGATGIGAATGLPAGVSASWADSVITISGDPTVSGTFSYSIPLTGGCGNVNATGTIIVTPNHSIALSSANSTQTRCQGVAIANITYSLSGGATGATVAGLPSGLTSSVNGTTLTITGSSTQTGTYSYTVTTTGNNCIVANETGTIIVTPNHSIALSSANSAQTRCQGVEIANITYNLGGGATSATISGLPTGISGSVSGTTMTIAGSSTQTGAYNYIVTTTGNSCTVASETGTIILNPLPEQPVLSTGPTNLCLNTNFLNLQAIGSSNTTFTWQLNSIIQEITNTVSGPQQNTSNALLSFPTSGSSTVTVITTFINTGCINSTDTVFTISNTPAPNARVIHNGQDYVCLLNDVDSYQWGYELKNSLEEVLLPGENHQNYHSPELANGTLPDTASRYIFVITKKGECYSKNYPEFNVPGRSYVPDNSPSNSTGLISVYPNPVLNKVNIRWTKELYENTIGLKIEDVLGRNVLNKRIDNRTAEGDATEDVSNLKSGVYIITLSDGKTNSVARFIKE